MTHRLCNISLRVVFFTQEKIIFLIVLYVFNATLQLFIINTH